MDNTIVELIQARLTALGLTTIPTSAELTFSIGKAQNYIKSFCNISEIPQALNYTLCDLACGYYLQDGALLNNIDGVDLSTGVEKSITEGDVTVSYGDSDTTDTKLKDFLKSSFINSQTELIKYRRLCW